MIIFFGIGTNLGNREQNLSSALRMLDERVGEQLVCSSIYYSAPQGFVSNNEFANIVVAYDTILPLEKILLLTQSIERELGRTHKSINGIYSDRIIDIDLLQAINNSEFISYHSLQLTIPHPRMQERDFVLIPLQEVMNKLS